MPGINKVMLIGHVGADPELRYLQDNVAVLRFSLATSEFIMKGGIRTEQTEWHQVVFWRSLAETGHKLLRKGKLVYLEGKCHTHSYEDKDGVKRYTTEVIAENFTLLGRNSDFEDQDKTFPTNTSFTG
jgi:single-strand DNA-binding protein